MMVEIEWDGVEMVARERQSLLDHLRALTRAVDPDGRARLQVEIAGTGGMYSVAVAGRDDTVQLGAEVRDADLAAAMARAIGLTLARWRAARDRRAPRR